MRGIGNLADHWPAHNNEYVASWIVILLALCIFSLLGQLQVI